MRLVKRRRPLTFPCCATAAACSCTCDLVLDEGGAVVAVTAAVSDLVLIYGGMKETCGVALADCRHRAQYQFFAILLTGLVVRC